MANQKWTISGEYMESCNCDYLCPCIFTNSEGPVTHDHCTALLVFRIDQGTCDGVDLSGLSFALVVRSGKIMADGGWVFGAVVDEAANEDQRRALTAIASGEAGGPPSMIRENLVSDFRGVEVRPIEFNIDGMSRSVSIPGVLDFVINGVPSRVAEGEPIYIDNVGHPAGTRLALAKSVQTHLHCFGLDMDLAGKDNNGHFAPFSWAA
jgi:hypothetical protein